MIEWSSINMYFSVYRVRQTRDMDHRFDCDWNSNPCATCDHRCFDSKYNTLVVSFSCHVVRSNMGKTKDIDMVRVARIT